VSSQVKEKKLTNDKASNGRPVQPNSVIPAERELERTSVVVKTLFLGLETKTETWTKWTRVHSSLETMVSKSQHWLHQFQLVTKHSL